MAHNILRITERGTDSYGNRINRVTFECAACSRKGASLDDSAFSDECPASLESIIASILADGTTIADYPPVSGQADIATVDIDDVGGAEETDE